jgi:hypothetical protein
MYSTVNLVTYCFRCKSSDVSWEPVPTGKALMGSVTQSQRFGFPLVSLIPYLNRYIFLRCRLTVCRDPLSNISTKLGSNCEKYF